MYVFCRLHGTNSLLNVSSWISYSQTLIWTFFLSKSLQCFQFLTGTRPNFSFLFPTPSSTVVWGPGTLIYLVPKHTFGLNPLCFCTCTCYPSNSFALQTIQSYFLWKSSSGSTCLEDLFLPLQPFQILPFVAYFQSCFLHKLFQCPQTVCCHL